MRSVCSAAALLTALAVSDRASAAQIPEPSAFRSAYEAQFPTAGASAGALALEDLAAKVGVPLAPRAPAEAGSLGLKPRYDTGRSEPTAEAAKEQKEHGPLAGTYLSAEIASPREHIGDPSPDVLRYFDNHSAVLDEIRAVLLGEADISWEVDVSQGVRGPAPNLLGIIRMERLLLARALLEARGGRADEALRTVEASWRLNEALASRPELISQLVAVSGARLLAGVLRKIDAPAFGWAERLRSGSILAGTVAAFENEVWEVSSDRSDLTGEEGVFGRALQRIGEEFRSRSRCGWTSSALQEIAAEAFRAEAQDEDDPIFPIAMPSLLGSLVRVARFEVDAELTALVVDARIERDAVRGRHWPGRLLTLGSGVCPKQAWTYTVLKSGTVRIAFEGSFPEDPSPRGPAFEFFAGKPHLVIGRIPIHRRVLRQ
ncbi:MAG: hypothetical protein ABI592_01330 [Acidobacteriota bacterium]